MEIRGGRGPPTVVLVNQLRNVLLQMADRGQSGRLLRLERNSWFKVGVRQLVVIRFLRCGGRSLLVLGGEERALEGDGVERARVGVHLFGPTRHQICAVAGVQLQL